MMYRRAGERLLPLAWLGLALGALSALALSGGMRQLLVDALSRISPYAVLVTLPAQAVACLLCGCALSLLRPGPSLGACILARSLRDAGANLLVFFPGIGEIVGARALVLSGCKTTPAVAASAIDNLAETIAQIPYGLLAFAMLPRLPIDLRLRSPRLIEDVLLLAVMSVGIGIAFTCTRRGRALCHRARADGRSAIVSAIADIAHRRRGFSGCVMLHVLAWASGGVGLWMAAHALSLPLGIGAAIVVESVVYAIRGIVFFVPAGLAVQEWAFVIAGGIYGLSPVQSLALALVLRLRDLTFGIVLLAWPVMELAHAMTARQSLRGAYGDTRSAEPAAIRPIHEMPSLDA